MKNRDKSLNLSILFNHIYKNSIFLNEPNNLPCDFRTSVNRPYKILHQWHCHHLLRFFDKLSFVFQKRIFRTNPLVEKIVVPLIRHTHKHKLVPLLGIYFLRSKDNRSASSGEIVHPEEDWKSSDSLRPAHEECREEKSRRIFSISRAFLLRGLPSPGYSIPILRTRKNVVLALQTSISIQVEGNNWFFFFF